MPHLYQQTSLWRRAFSKLSDPDDPRSRLASIYATAWERACSIAARIKTDASGLTLHDERHFERLWQCCDLLCGHSVHLNAIETFVLGVSILIHDAGHTLLAYKGGLASIIQTSEWKDALASDKEGRGLIDGNHDQIPIEIRRKVLFQTLRALHAAQAPVVLEKAFNHPSLGSSFFIIEDPTIRSHFGRLIGEIAASHHWHAGRITTLGRQKNPVSPYDRDGPIRTMLLAAILRCADAIQIDAARAPDFEFTLEQPIGASLEHWTSQNRLSAAPDIKNPAALLITSSLPFERKEANAWWVAYDLAKSADHELRIIDLLLRDNDLPLLEIKTVVGASDPQRFLEHVPTVDWEPVDTEIRIRDTAKIVEMFGGRGLYGDDPAVPLRELLQNAVDAVRARRRIDQSYRGQITVSLNKVTVENASARYELSIADDGLGMSTGVLTGPFLTFGESGWASPALRMQRPGLIASFRNSIGRFGIGFFSSFMITDHVIVSTRPFDASANKVRSLEFTKGAATRPVLTIGPESLGMLTSTRCTLFISGETREKILVKPARPIFSVSEMPKREYYSLKELVDMICPAIDVRIDIYTDQIVEGVINADWNNEDCEQWLCRILNVGSEEIPGVIKDNYDMFDLIIDQGEPVGRAILNPTNVRMSVHAVNGFGRKKNPSVSYGNSFVGCLDTVPAGPKRDRGEFRSKSTLQQWAQSQVSEWAKRGLPARERCFLAANACIFGCDPLSLATCLLNDHWVSVSDVLDRLIEGEKVFAPIKSDDFEGSKWLIMGNVNRSSGLLFRQEEIEVTISNVLRAGPTEEIKEYWRVPDREDPFHHSFLGCLARLADARGRRLQFEGKKIDFGRYIGDDSPRERLINGETLTFPGLEISIN